MHAGGHARPGLNRLGSAMQRLVAAQAVGSLPCRPVQNPLVSMSSLCSPSFCPCCVIDPVLFIPACHWIPAMLSNSNSMCTATCSPDTQSPFDVILQIEFQMFSRMHAGPKRSRWCSRLSRACAARSARYTSQENIKNLLPVCKRWQTSWPFAAPEKEPILRCVVQRQTCIPESMLSTLP
jgi:hypothetical protein